MNSRKIIAVDFDGTLFTDCYPNIGKPIDRVINYCKNRRKSGDILILWTCRNGEELEQALVACKSVGLEFDYVNESAKENLALYNNVDSRKISADIYIDDRCLSVYDI